jgi:hypothetical protein
MMDYNEKLEQLTQLMEHPERFTEAEKEILLSDDDIRELYETMVEARMAMLSSQGDDTIGAPDVEQEYARFIADRQIKTRTIALIKWRKIAAAIAALLVVSGLGYAAYRLSRPTSEPSAQPQTVTTAQPVKTIAPADTARQDTVKVAPKPLLYNNVELQTIVNDLCAHYGVQATYENAEARHLRLYLQIAPGQSIDEVVELLNHFEKVNIEYQSNRLIIR